MRRDLGDGVNLRHLVYDRDNVLTAATVVLTVTKPDGTTVTPSLTATSTGIYEAGTFTADAVGLWSYLWSVSGTVTDQAPGSFTVETAVDRMYVGLALLKDSLGIPSTDATRDNLLELARAAGSRTVDDHTGRRFWTEPEDTIRTAPARVHRGRDGARLLIPDYASLTTVATGSGSSYDEWSADAYELAYFDEGDSDTAIVGIISLGPSWPSGLGRVRLTGRPGWPGVPDNVEEAALILAARYFRRKDSPEGIMGAAEWGGIRVSRSDPDVVRLLARYTRPGIG